MAPQGSDLRFLADDYVPCEICKGRRFNDATLAVTLKDKSIADILDTTVDEALELFGVHGQNARVAGSYTGQVLDGVLARLRG